jgi:hypothetical protein
MLIYKGKTYSNRKEFVKEMGAAFYTKLIKTHSTDLILIKTENIESYESISTTTTKTNKH